jgi:hypothetical protein
MNDTTVAEYTREIERLTEVWTDLQGQLKAAKTEAERKRINRALFSTKFARGVLRQTVEYLSTPWVRLHTPGADEFEPWD